jgi:hypothetical protein
MGRFFRGIVVGAFAAFGAFSLGAGPTTIAVAFLIPIFAAAIDILAIEVFTIAVLFGIGSILWSYTPIGPKLGDFLQKNVNLERKSAGG